MDSTGKENMKQAQNYNVVFFLTKIIQSCFTNSALQNWVYLCKDLVLLSFKKKTWNSTSQYCHCCYYHNRNTIGFSWIILKSFNAVRRQFPHFLCHYIELYDCNLDLFKLWPLPKHLASTSLMIKLLHYRSITSSRSSSSLAYSLWLSVIVRHPMSEYFPIWPTGLQTFTDSTAYFIGEKNGSKGDKVQYIKEWIFLLDDRLAIWHSYVQYNELHCDTKLLEGKWMYIKKEGGQITVMCLVNMSFREIGHKYCFFFVPFFCINPTSFTRLKVEVNPISVILCKHWNVNAIEKLFFNDFNAAAFIQIIQHTWLSCHEGPCSGIS